MFFSFNEVELSEELIQVDISSNYAVLNQDENDVRNYRFRNNENQLRNS